MGSKIERVKYKPNKIYRLEHQDIDVKAGKEVTPLEWFCNDMFELKEQNLSALNDDPAINFRIMDHYTTKFLDPDFSKPVKMHGFESKSTFGKFKVPMKYLIREKTKAQGNFIAELVDSKEKCVVGRVFLNLGSYGYPIAKKTVLPHKFKKVVYADKPTKQKVRT